MKHDVPPSIEEHRCAITGKELPADELVELFGYRVGAEGKAILLDRLRARKPARVSVDYPGVMERVRSAMYDALPLFLFFPFGSIFGSYSINAASAPSFCVPLYLIVMTAAMRGQSVGMRRHKLRLTGVRGKLSAFSVVIRTCIIAFLAWQICFLPFAYLAPGPNILSVAALCAAVWLLLDWAWLAFRRDGQMLHDWFTGTRVVSADAEEFRWLGVDQLGWSGQWDRARVICPRCHIEVTGNLAGPAIGAPLPVRDELTCDSCGWRGTLYLFRPVPLETSAAEPALANEAVCTQHPTKRATATCEKSGDYCCSLCLVAVDGAKLSAGYLQAHPGEREKMWPSLPAVDKPSLVIAGNYVALPRSKRAKQQSETRLGYEKIESMLVWSEKKSFKHAAAGLGLLGLAAGLLVITGAQFFVVITASALGVMGVQQLIAFSKPRVRLVVCRAGEELEYSPSAVIGDFGKVADSLVTAIWRCQQAGIRAWFEKHPKDPHAPAIPRPAVVETPVSTGEPTRGDPD